MNHSIGTPSTFGGSARPHVGIVVLHWNNYPASERCLRSLAQITYPAATVYFLDNGSTDGSMDRLEREFTRAGLVWLRNGENLGFAAGCNPGIERALADGCRYVLLLNNDCIAATPDLLEGAVELAEADPRCGIVGGKVLGWPEVGRILGVGGWMGWGQDIISGFGEPDRGQYAEVAETGYVSGALMLIKREVLERVGLLPEAYFFGYEDREYSLQVLRSGYRLLYHPRMVAYHEAGGSHQPADSVFLYNDALSRILYKRRTLSRTSFRLWLAVFRIYVELLLPVRALVQRSRFIPGATPRRLRDIAREAITDANRIERINAETLAAYRARHGSARPQAESPAH